MAKLSRDKGKRGERMWRDELREVGYLKARRGQQFAGSNGDADVVCPELEALHFEVKFVETLNVRKAMEQAESDAVAGKLPMVAHKTSRAPWLVTMPARVLFKLLRGDLVLPPMGDDIPTLAEVDELAATFTD